MSPIAPINTGSTHYMSTSTDAITRHEYGVQKHRKQSSTGGGRAWSEDEEVYLLQTRLQKMPYKHIAAHLKKTELACRLHYHQLSHGSNRRKRSCSTTPSESSVRTNSPIMSSSLPLAQSMPSPIHEHSVSPAPSLSHSPPALSHIQLPSASSLLCQTSPSRTPSPHQQALGHPIAILPKPLTPPLRLMTPAKNLNGAAYPFAERSTHAIDFNRLRNIYEAHRNSFWSNIAAEYGSVVDAYTLEEAWRSYCANPTSTTQRFMPPTPCVSPDSHTGGSYYKSDKATTRTPSPQLPAIASIEAPGKTSISSLLGIDASPRSPEERELVRRIEERRDSREPVEMA